MLRKAGLQSQWAAVKKYLGQVLIRASSQEKPCLMIPLLLMRMLSYFLSNQANTKTLCACALRLGNVR